MKFLYCRYFVWIALLSGFLFACGGGSLATIEPIPEAKGSGNANAQSASADPGCYPLVQTTGDDPLRKYQWYLRATTNRDNYFTPRHPTDVQLDLNLPPDWSSSSGSGVNVTVVDTGLEVKHEDLASNVICGGSYNFLTKTNNPTNTATTGDHGTSVAGIIAGIASNGVGIAGIAPKANLRAYNFLTSGSQTYINYGIAFGAYSEYGAVKSDIFNYSAGSQSVSFESPKVQIDTVQKYAITSLRDGKGALLVKSAGNAFSGMRDSANQLVGYSVDCRDAGVTCQNVNQDTENSFYGTIVVAAVNALMTRSTYSSTGSAIWVSGIGGQAGYDPDVVGNTTFADQDYLPGMVTIDQTGCNSGYVGVGALSSLNGAKNNFDKSDGTGVENTNCSYTSTFTGTSAAAPTVSGVIALMLQANPALTWRDVRHILATTARRVLVDALPVASPTNTFVSQANNSVSITIEQGWVQNNAQGGYRYWFHNHFGFGLVDAAAAVTSARAHTNLSVQKSIELSRTISANEAQLFRRDFNGRTFSFPNATGMNIVEQAELTLYVDDDFVPYCNQVELTSPAGTTSILLNLLSSHSSASKNGMRLLSNAFYGESASGVWVLKMYNKCEVADWGEQKLSTAVAQKLVLYGRD